jgi:hypothetical protein
MFCKQLLPDRMALTPRYLALSEQKKSFHAKQKSFHSKQKISSPKNYSMRQTLSFSNISLKPFPKIQNPIHQSKYPKTFYPSLKTKTAKPFQTAKRFIFSKSPL